VNIGDYLEEEGLKRTYNLTGMAVELNTLNGSGKYPKKLMVKKVDSSETLSDFVDVMSHCFDIVKAERRNDFYAIEESYGFSDKLPKQNFIGYLKGKPVASSTMVLGNGVVGVFNVATVPKARKKGIGTLMTLIPLQEARAMGYKVGILHSPNNGSSMTQRIGFREYCKISAYRLA
jgi:ribosomal protein S18 acetylase RimI-like enzyme